MQEYQYLVGIPVQGLHAYFECIGNIRNIRPEPLCPVEMKIILTSGSALSQKHFQLSHPEKSNSVIHAVVDSCCVRKGIFSQSINFCHTPTLI